MLDILGHANELKRAKLYSPNISLLFQESVEWISDTPYIYFYSGYSNINKENYPTRNIYTHTSESFLCIWFGIFVSEIF